MLKQYKDNIKQYIERRCDKQHIESRCGKRYKLIYNRTRDGEIFKAYTENEELRFYISYDAITDNPYIGVHGIIRADEDMDWSDIIEINKEG